MISFMLRHQLLVIPETGKDVQRWLSLKLLGTGLLIKKRYPEFFQWLSVIKFLYLKMTGKDLNLEKEEIVRFYENAGKREKTKRLNSIEGQFQNYLNKISPFLEKIDPDTHQENIKNCEDFKKIIILTQISKLSSQKYKILLVRDVFDDFILLNKSRFPVVNYTSDIPEGIETIETHKGTLQTLLDQLWKCIIEENTQDAPIEIHVSTTFSSISKRVILKIDSSDVDFENSTRIFDDELFIILWRSI